jgi:hypothetical protein
VDGYRVSEDRVMKLGIWKLNMDMREFSENARVKLDMKIAVKLFRERGCEAIK